MAPQFVAISEREEDLKFGKGVADEFHMEFHQVSTAQMARATISELTQPVVFWDVDHAKANFPGADNGVDAIGKALAQVIASERVVAVSSTPLNSMPYLAQATCYNHHMSRRYDDLSRQLYARLAFTCVDPDPFGISRYFADDVTVQKIVLKKASERHKAVEALNRIFLKRGGNPRMAGMVSTTCDEMLKNGIFSAPVDAQGRKLRGAASRTEDFELTGQ